MNWYEKKVNIKGEYLIYLYKQVNSKCKFQQGKEENKSNVQRKTTRRKGEELEELQENIFHNIKERQYKINM